MKMEVGTTTALQRGRGRRHQAVRHAGELPSWTKRALPVVQCQLKRSPEQRPQPGQPASLQLACHQPPATSHLPPATSHPTPPIRPLT